MVNMTTPIKLELPNIKYKESFLEARLEFITQVKPNPSEKHYQEYSADGFEDMVNSFLQEIKKAEPDFVTQTRFWIIDKDGYAGRISLRHELNDYLCSKGGHIGYDIRPSKRGLGYAKTALRLCFQEAHKMGMDKIFITCLDYLKPSHKTILGVLQEYGGKEIEPLQTAEGKYFRFWINTTKNN